MVGHTVLRVVVGAYLFTAVTTADLCAPLGGNFVGLLTHLDIIKLCTQKLESFVTVFEL